MDKTKRIKFSKEGPFSEINVFTVTMGNIEASRDCVESFRDRFINCKADGTVKEIKVYAYPLFEESAIFLCTKHLEQCSSNLCKQDRCKQGEE
jgi:hypothetical protein